MDDADRVLSNAIDGMVRNTKCGTSLWTIFRWLANMVYALCWILALPVELVFNRRMGRRYTGTLPLAVALPIFALLLGGTQYVLSNAAQYLPPRDAARLGAATSPALSLVLSVGIVGLVMIALLAHRVANWYRFRSDEQVHSHSDGVPFWVLPPRWLIAATSTTARASEQTSTRDDLRSAVTSIAMVEPKPEVFEKNPGALAVFRKACRGFASHLRSEWRRFVSEWRRGDLPTGAITWYAATIVHPVLLFVLAMLVTPAHVGAGIAMQVAALAIFIKARIQKAITVEMIYDIFDARIEQEFKTSLDDPVRLRNVERRGFAVPGIAHVAALGAVHSGTDHRPGTLDPRFAALLSQGGSDGNGTQS